MVDRILLVIGHFMSILVQLLRLMQLGVPYRLVLCFGILLNLSALDQIAIVHRYTALSDFVHTRMSLCTNLLLLRLFQFVHLPVVLCLLGCEVEMLVKQVIVFQLQLCILLLSGFVLITTEDVEIYLVGNLLFILWVHFIVDFICIYQIFVIALHDSRVLVFLVSISLATSIGRSNTFLLAEFIEQPFSRTLR